MVNLETGLKEFYFEVYAPAKGQLLSDRQTKTAYQWELARFDRYLLAAEGRPATLADLVNRPPRVEEVMRWTVEHEANQPTTANKFRRHLNAIWEFAAKRGYVTERPINEAYRVDLAAPVALTKEEFAAILEAAAGLGSSLVVGGVAARLWWPACILFLYWSGLRRSAALRVPTPCLDWAAAEVSVPAELQKHRREQLLDLSDQTMRSLAALRLAERGVPTILGDWTMTARSWVRHWQNLFLRAGIYRKREEIPRYTHGAHILRRTLACNIYEQRGLHAASERLDHSSTKVTERYIDPRWKRRERISGFLPDPIAPPPADRPPLRIADVG